MREREEIIIGNPGFAKHRDEVIRQRIEEQRAKRLGTESVPELKPRHNPWLMVAAVIVSTGLSLANCYGFLRERDINQKVNEMQEINDRVIFNELRDLRHYIDRVNYRK